MLIQARVILTWLSASDYLLTSLDYNNNFGFIGEKINKNL